VIAAFSIAPVVVLILLSSQPMLLPALVGAMMGAA
jgi:hypothetical protein